MPKKSQDGQELFDMGKMYNFPFDKATNLDQFNRWISSEIGQSMSGKKVILIAGVIGIIFYYFLVHRRK